MRGNHDLKNRLVNGELDEAEYQSLKDLFIRKLGIRQIFLANALVATYASQESVLYILTCQNKRTLLVARGQINC